MRSVGIVLALVACNHAASVLDIHADDGKSFTKIELFFTDGAIEPVTDPALLPRSTPGVLRVTAASGQLDARKFDPADIYMAPEPTSHVTLGIPNGTGLGRYLAVIAYGAQGPIEYGEVTEVDDTVTVKYDIPLSPITNEPALNYLLQPVVWKTPCIPATATADTCAHTNTTSFPPLGPVPGMGSYTVTVRVRGVMETATYVGSAVASAELGWYAGGAPVNGTRNVFALHTTSPDATYYLNNGPIEPTVRPWDYFATFTVDAGSMVTYGIVDTDGVQQNNANHVVAGTGLDPYDGQYAQLDVVDIVGPTNAVRRWPVGAEIWSRPATAPSCLRLTTELTTHFVVTAGDADCDGYPDGDTDCDATLFCDPQQGSLGCVTACTEQFDGDQTRLSACVNGRKTSDDKCPASDAPPSFCVAQDAACPTKPPIKHQTVFDCLTQRHPDVTCRFAITPSGCPDDLYLQLPSEVTAAQCAGITVLSMSPQGESLLLHPIGVGPCVVSVKFASPPDANAFGDLMLGIPTTAGGYDTLVVHAIAQPDTTCPAMACGEPVPHDCR